VVAYEVEDTVVVGVHRHVPVIRSLLEHDELICVIDAEQSDVGGDIDVFWLLFREPLVSPRNGEDFD
jgi:hypothetical protein